MQICCRDFFCLVQPVCVEIYVLREDLKCWTTPLKNRGGQCPSLELQTTAIGNKLFLLLSGRHHHGRGRRGGPGARDHQGALRGGHEVRQEVIDICVHNVRRKCENMLISGLCPTTTSRSTRCSRRLFSRAAALATTSGTIFLIHLFLAF